jgi:hypothetical protein
MKRRISASEGAVRLKSVTLLPDNADFVNGWKLVAICLDEAANQFSARKVAEACPSLGRLVSIILRTSSAFPRIFLYAVSLPGEFVRCHSSPPFDDFHSGALRQSNQEILAGSKKYVFT